MPSHLDVARRELPGNAMIDESPRFALDAGPALGKA